MCSPAACAATSRCRSCCALRNACRGAANSQRHLGDRARRLKRRSRRALRAGRILLFKYYEYRLKNFCPAGGFSFFSKAHAQGRCLRMITHLSCTKNAGRSYYRGRAHVPCLASMLMFFRSFELDRATWQHIHHPRGSSIPHAFSRGHRIRC